MTEISCLIDIITRSFFLVLPFSLLFVLILIGFLEDRDSPVGKQMYRVGKARCSSSLYTTGLFQD